MDGTLLNNASEVAPRTTAAIAAATARGAFFTTISGRSLMGMRQFAAGIPWNTPIGIFNGAMIVDPADGYVHYQQGVDAEDARWILRWAREEGTNYFLWADQELYGNALGDPLFAYAAMSGATPRLIEDEERLLARSIAKILWYDTPARVAGWMRHVREEQKGGAMRTVNVSTSAPDFIEFNHADVSKGAALGRIAEMLGVPQEETIAAGDEGNDLSMVKWAGLGIAMKNATPPVKEAADLISPWTNDEDGLARLVEQYLCRF